MDRIILAPQYLPPIDYFISVLSSDKIYYDISANYSKQTYCNRTCILGANKVERLSIPIVHTSGIKSAYSSVNIDHSHNWSKNHLKSIRSAYGKAPYFDYYFDLFEKIYLLKLEKLVDFNIQILTVCLKLLKTDFAKKVIIWTGESTDNGEILDLRDLIHPKKEPYNLDIISMVSYKQLFGNKFVYNLSIMDLLFNEGTDAPDLLKKAISRSQKTERMVL